MAFTQIIPIYGFSNSFILKGDSAIIIDAGLPGLDKKILKTLEQNGISRDHVSLIIVTHGHGDHTGSLRTLKEALNAPVMAGSPDAGFIEKGQSAPRVPVSLKGRIMKPFTNMGVNSCKVDLVVKEEMDLNAYGVDARVLTTPGHTFGSLSVLTSDGDCMIGDLFGSMVFKNSIGMTPLAEAPEMIGPSLKKIMDSGAKYLYPGHGNHWPAEAVERKFASVQK